MRTTPDEGENVWVVLTKAEAYDLMIGLQCYFADEGQQVPEWYGSTQRQPVRPQLDTPSPPSPKAASSSGRAPWTRSEPALGDSQFRVADRIRRGLRSRARVGAVHGGGAARSLS